MCRKFMAAGFYCHSKRAQGGAAALGSLHSLSRCCLWREEESDLCHFHGFIGNVINSDCTWCGY